MLTSQSIRARVGAVREGAVFTELYHLTASQTTTSYRSLIAAAFFLGLAGSSFAVGAAFVSRWLSGLALAALV